MTYLKEKLSSRSSERRSPRWPRSPPATTPRSAISSPGHEEGRQDRVITVEEAKHRDHPGVVEGMQFDQVPSPYFVTDTADGVRARGPYILIHEKKSPS